jgi:hypothetical protein
VCGFNDTDNEAFTGGLEKKQAISRGGDSVWRLVGNFVVDGKNFFARYMRG